MRSPMSVALSLRRRARRVDHDAAVGELASLVARSAATGASVLAAFEEAAALAPSEVTGDLERLRARHSRGVPLAEALERWRAESDSDATDLLVAAAQVGLVEGGAFGAAMDGVAVALADRAELRAEARAQTAQARLSAYVLVALPPFGLAVFALVDSSVLTTVFTTPVGLACLVLGLLLDLAGAVVSARIVDSVMR